MHALARLIFLFCIFFFFWTKTMERGGWRSMHQKGPKTIYSLTALPLRIIWISLYSCREVCFPSLLHKDWSDKLCGWIKETTETASCSCTSNAAGKARTQSRVRWRKVSSPWFSYIYIYIYIYCHYNSSIHITLFLWISSIAGYNPLLHRP